MASTSTLLKIAFVVIFAIWVHNAAKPARDDIKQEKACIAQAEDVGECLKLMEENKARRDRK